MNEMTQTDTATALFEYMRHMPENDIGAYDTSSRTLIQISRTRLELTSRGNIRLVEIYSNFPERGQTILARGAKLTNIPADLQAAVEALQ